MEILEIDKYLDGGTIKIITDNNEYYFDKRISSTTKGRLYLSYPLKDNSNIVEDYKSIENDIIFALDHFNPDAYEIYIMNEIREIIKLHN